jgi:hypothetical protein
MPDPNEGDLVGRGEPAPPAQMPGAAQSPGGIGGSVDRGVAGDPPIMPSTASCTFWDAAVHGRSLRCDLAGLAIGDYSTPLVYIGGVLRGDFASGYGDPAHRITIDANNHIEIAEFDNTGGGGLGGDPYPVPPTRSWSFDGDCADNLVTGHWA